MRNISTARNQLRSLSSTALRRIQKRKRLICFGSGKHGKKSKLDMHVYGSTRVALAGNTTHCCTAGQQAGSLQAARCDIGATRVAPLPEMTRKRMLFDDPSDGLVVTKLVIFYIHNTYNINT
jgi:hypothetical protein